MKSPIEIWFKPLTYVLRFVKFASETPLGSCRVLKIHFSIQTVSWTNLEAEFVTLHMQITPDVLCFRHIMHCRHIGMCIWQSFCWRLLTIHLSCGCWHKWTTNHVTCMWDTSNKSIIHSCMFTAWFIQSTYFFFFQRYFNLAAKLYMFLYIYICIHKPKSKPTSSTFQYLGYIFSLTHIYLSTFFLWF